MNRHQMRELAMQCLYQSFLLKKDIKSVVFENVKVTNKIDPFLYAITIDACANKKILIKNINRVLNKEWSFEILGYVEQAILIIAACELQFETAHRSVIIDEAITIAKKYCGDDTYKLINGVLDRL